jgi:hypothetical protein
MRSRTAKDWRLIKVAVSNGEPRVEEGSEYREYGSIKLEFALTK